MDPTALCCALWYSPQMYEIAFYSYKIPFFPSKTLSPASTRSFRFQHLRKTAPMLYTSFSRYLFHVFQASACRRLSSPSA